MKRCIRGIIIGLLISAVLFDGVAASENRIKDVATELDLDSKSIQLDELINKAMSEDSAKGLAFIVFNGKGENLYQNCFGYRDEEKKLPVTPDTIFGLASITKSFTALSIMQLAEKGVINVNELVSKYIPEFTLQGITISHLLNNSSGIPGQTRSGRNKMLVSKIARDLKYTPEKNGDFAFNEILGIKGANILINELNSIQKQDFVGKPGENYCYSNDGYSLLAEVIRRHGDEKTYASYVKEEIFAPLDMSRSGGNYIWSDDNVSVLYDREGNTYDFYYDQTSVSGNGGLKSTINDMKKYVCMYMNMGKGLDGKTLVAAKAVEEMTKQRIQTDINKSYIYYGYGLENRTNAIPRICHGGGQTGVSSWMVWSADNEIGVVVLCNTRDINVSGIAYEALRIYKEGE